MRSTPRGGSYLVSRIPPAWQEVLDPAIVDHVRAVGDQLSARVGHEHIVPSPEQVFRALEVPPEQVSVLLIGQDPYPTAGHAMGLSFSVPKGVTPLPPSAKNIRAELVSDLGVELPGHFDLSDWVSQGVLLLNRHLTTQVGNPGAHHRLGWTTVTDEIVRTVVQLNPSLVSILWGKTGSTGERATWRYSENRISPPLTAICSSRVFWLPAVFASKRAVRTIGPSAHRLVCVLGHRTKRR